MPLPLQPQLTGPYFANLRQTLLGGKSFNRFSNFVTSGAEDWVLHGPSEEEAHPAVPAADQPKNGPEKHLRASTSSTTDDAQTVLGDTAPEPERHYVDVDAPSLAFKIATVQSFGSFAF
ncbi:hypothetical protein FRB99_001874 [Tulasnella sp. 403]|nr:hypothetical protein FRB99_001874 [Tulasnella sp. 403]